ncbi:MAG: hypothetical protein ABL949_09980 [Fimbriimonadaceae bacterium]
MRLLVAISFFLLTVFGLAQSLPRGTEIRVMLLKQLNSGGSVLDEEVPLMVLEDIKVGRQTLIREGTLTVAKVRQVRREGAFSATIFDKPARLAIEVASIRDESGREIKLASRMNGRDRQLVQFNRENTKVRREADIEAALGNGDGLKAGKMLVDALRGAQSIEDIDNSIVRTTLLELARGLRFGNVYELVKDRRLNDLIAFGSLLAKPGLATLIAVPSAISVGLMTVRAVKEIARIGRHLPNFISRKFGGRNINAPVGLEFSVFVDRS